jgi:alpha-2-macroglobulin-like protein
MDARGTWYSTQATVLALKALLAAHGQALGGSQTRKIEIQVDGRSVATIDIPADQANVVRQIDLSKAVAAGKHRIGLVEHTKTETGYQVLFRHHVPAGADRSTEEPLRIELEYDRTTLTLNDRARATVKLLNRTGAAMPMVIVDLPIPAGFAVAAEDFDRLVAAGSIARYQLTPRQVIVYLRELAPGKPLELSYALRATAPLKVTAPSAQAYEYYNPDRRARSASVQLTVR